MKITTSEAVYASYPSNEWVVDFETGMNTEPQDILEAIEQDMKFALGTERFKYPIMGGNFGVTLNDLVGSDYRYIKSEIERRIKDALSIDDRVDSVDSFTFTQTDNEGLLVNCVVHTVSGDIPIDLRVGE